MSEISDTIGLMPLLERMPLPMRVALGRGFGEPVEYGDEAEIEPHGPPGCVRLLAAQGIVRMVRVLSAGEFAFPHEEAGFSDMHPGEALERFARRRFGGAVLPEVTDGRLRLVADGRVRVYTLTREQIDAVERGLRVRHLRRGFRRLMSSLEIARMLAVSPMFGGFDRRERHAVANAMEWKSLPVGARDAQGWGPFGKLAVIGEGMSVAVEIEDGGPVKDATLGYGDVFGLAEVLARRSGGEARIRARVTVAGRAAVLPPLSPSALVRAVPSIRKLYRSLAPIGRNLPLFTRALAESPLFEGFSHTFFYRLLIAGRPVLWRVGNHPPPALEFGPGLLIVYEGELLQHDRDGKRVDHMSVVATVGPGQLHGERAFVAHRRASYRLEPRVPTRLLVLPAYALFEAMSFDPECVRLFIRNAIALRRNLAFAEGGPTTISAAARRPLDVALLRPLGRLPPGLDAVEIARQVGQSVTDQFGEPTAVIRVRAAAAPPVEGAVPVLTAATADRDLRAAVLAALDHAADATQAIIVVEPSQPTGWLEDEVDRITYLNGGPDVVWPPSSGDTPFTYATVVDGATHDPARDCPYPPGAVRLTRQPGYTGGLTPGQIDRWARALTERRVGVALGGGGSWGYCHVAVIRALQQLGIPIDAVSGTSFGAVVGAFHAHDVEHGMDRLLDEQMWVQVSNWGNYVSGVIFERMLDAVFRGQRLESVECPFLPVATDLVTGSQTVLHAGTLGRGVRASGAYAPILPAVQTRKATYVDGGMSANVPAHVLVHEGAALVISSDAVPASAERPGYVSVIDCWPLDLAMDMVNLRRRVSAYLSGQQALFNTAGELSAALAPVQFESNKSVSFAGLLLNGRKIVNNALTDPDFWSSLKLAEEHWDAMKRPRVR